MLGEDTNLNVTLKNYVIETAEEKAKMMFDGSMNMYINYLICKDNKGRIRRKILELERKLEAKKPKKIAGTGKKAMYSNTCEFCKMAINPGEEICQAEGYSNFIHSKCCKK
ncbi:hypothetical protein GOM49_04780 [Clostridium bovifaecis]|uniref:Uncharacterized protein n=1 Tax=Clostridium bovifaecis TaxID=2184719 RepID=A0A6I6EUH1_9CLOT|nr:hypothetical protein GOM49_04780 [Clostridium bovifaecis]